MSGLGGQGVVTAAHILDSAATRDGKQSTVNLFFDGLQPGGKVLINADTPLELNGDDLGKLARLNAKIFYIPATRIAGEVGGTELSTNMVMLGGLMGIADLVSYEALRESIQERFGGGKFVASGTTAAFDDILNSKYEKVAQLVEKNMELIEKAAASFNEYVFNSRAEGWGENNSVCFG
jgi:pyruvate ferredoxin oxidoreductase gamma subunit